VQTNVAYPRRYPPPNGTSPNTCPADKHAREMTCANSSCRACRPARTARSQACPRSSKICAKTECIRVLHSPNGVRWRRASRCNFAGMASALPERIRVCGCHSAASRRYFRSYSRLVVRRRPRNAGATTSIDRSLACDPLSCTRSVPLCPGKTRQPRQTVERQQEYGSTPETAHASTEAPVTFPGIAKQAEMGWVVTLARNTRAQP